MGLCGRLPDALGRSSSGMLEWRVSFFSQFFRKYLTPEERADVLLVAIEAMINGSSNDVFAASKMLKMILRYSVTEVAKVGFEGTPCSNVFLFCFGGIWFYFLSPCARANPNPLTLKRKVYSVSCFQNSAKAILSRRMKVCF